MLRKSAGGTNRKKDIEIATSTITTNKSRTDKVKQEREIRVIFDEWTEHQFHPYLLQMLAMDD